MLSTIKKYMRKDYFWLDFYLLNAYLLCYLLYSRLSVKESGIQQWTDTSLMNLTVDSSDRRNNGSYQICNVEGSDALVY